MEIDVARKEADKYSMDTLEGVDLFDYPAPKPALDDLDEREMGHLLEWLEESWGNANEGSRHV